MSELFDVTESLKRISGLKSKLPKLLETLMKDKTPLEQELVMAMVPATIDGLAMVLMKGEAAAVPAAQLIFKISGLLKA